MTYHEPLPMRMDRLEAHRNFFANLITTAVGKPNSRVTAAFAAIPREDFLGPGPWRILSRGGYISTPTADPAFLYQDVPVALSEEKNINNGQPTLHALALSTLNPNEGDTVIHVGAGTGYYTALLRNLVGPGGQVFAYEIDPELAAIAKANLAGMPNVAVYARSGTESPLPACDVCYVNAGATQPLDVWLDALQPKGKLLFPLTPDGPDGSPGMGAMLLITRTATERFDARFIMPVMFIPCLGARDEKTAKKLALAFKRGDGSKVLSLRRNEPVDGTCWVDGEGWWLSTAPCVIGNQ
jgi:protein-L-isoaspartate(D-aspartate) O-methyltransferase